MNLQFMKRSHAPCRGHAATCSEVRNSNPAGVKATNRVSQVVNRTIAILAIIFISGVCYGTSPLVFLGSIPENGSSVTSLSKITLRYDLSNVEDKYAETVPGELGICCHALNSTKPTKCRVGRLYEGTEEDGILLSTISEGYYEDDSTWSPSPDLVLEFPDDIDIKPGQLYTFVNILDIYVCKPGTGGETPAETDYYYEPMVLSFYGATSGIEQKLVCESNSIQNKSLETFSEVNLVFNHRIDKTDKCLASLWEDNTKISNATECIVDESGNGLVVKFDEITTYYSHNYYVLLEEGSVKMVEDEAIINKEISIFISGASYHMFGVKSTIPRGGTSLLDRIAVTFDFPENSGIVYANNRTYPMQIIAESGDVLKTVNGVVETSNQVLVFYPEYSFDAGTTYKFVIDEDVVKAYDLNYSNAVQLKDYKCERIELSFSTPEESEMGNVSFKNTYDTPVLLEEIQGYSIELADYQYNYEDYAIKEATGEHYATLIEVLENSEETIGEYEIRVYNNEIYVPTFVEAPKLIAGHNYKLIIPAGVAVPNHTLLSKYAGNEELTIKISGTYRDSFNVVIIGTDCHATKTIVPRNQDVVLEFAPAEDWVISSVKHGENTIDLDENNRYTINSINEDATISVAHDYKGTLEVYDLTTDVTNIEVEGTDYVVSREDGMIKIYNLKANEDMVSVYSVGGQLICAPRTACGDMMMIAINPGIYIVRINNIAFKVKI